MRLGVCISVYRIGKNTPPPGRYVVRTVVCVYKNVEDSMFSSLCALVDYQCITSVFNCMRLCAAHSVSRVVFFCAMHVCANMIHSTN